VRVYVHHMDDHAETIVELYLRTMLRVLYRTTSVVTHTVRITR
jgi:hypothetical protein